MSSPLAVRTRVPGAVSARVDHLDGRRIVVVDIDPTRKAGALNPADGATLTAAAELALAERIPLVACIASAGADVNEGVAALDGWGRTARALVACSGIVPTIAIVDGPTVSGPAMLLGLVDLVVMTHAGYAFVTGPQVIRDVTGVRISGPELGGVDVHARRSGVADLVAVDLDDAWDQVAEVLSYLPDHLDAVAPRHRVGDPPTRTTPEAAGLLPETSMGSYDVREVVACIVDDGHVVELRPGWAPNLVTALATLDGRPVGIVANQPRSIAGTLDIPASQKGARFVSWCDALGLPLITFVDTPGFYPGKDLEWRGMIRKGAQLAFAYARATVPRLSVTLRKSYGGAFIVMDAKTMGNDLAFAWPSAEIAVMGAKGAVEILHRRVDETGKADLEAEYTERLLNPWMAAERGYLDAVIDPADTRVALCAGLDLLSSKRETLVTRSHDNSPL